MLHFESGVLEYALDKLTFFGVDHCNVCICRDVTAYREITANLCPETASSSLLPSKLSKVDLACSLASHTPPYLSLLSKNDCYDIRI